MSSNYTETFKKEKNKLEVQRNTKPSADNQPQKPPDPVVPIQFMFNDVNRPLYTPMYFNPFLTNSHTIMPSNFNSAGYQGIFIPQTTENSPYYFIPGNIVADKFNVELTQNEFLKKAVEEFEGHEKGTKDDGIIHTPREGILFVPSLEVSSRISDDDIGCDADKFETYLVPVKITKETNGSIELFPERNTDNIPQTPNPEQLNILKKIAHFKNQQLTRKLTDSIENNATGSQNILNNLQDKTEGYVMFRFNKDQMLPVQSTQNKDTSATNSLQISAVEMRKKKQKNKKRQKTHKLKLSANSDKLSSTALSTTSRFRRLRVDDRTQCWNSSGITCIDTRMRDVPSQIISLSETNSIVIPDGLFNYIKQDDLTNTMHKDYIRRCEHGLCLDSKETEKQDEIKEKFSFWRYMCSMNNCEFIPAEKELI